MTDQTLATDDATPDTLPDPDAPLAGEHTHDTDTHTDGTAWSVEEVLAMAELPERTALVCLKPNLQGEWDRLVAELATLVTPTGEPLDDDEETSAGEKSSTGRAFEITNRLADLRREMQKSMWAVTFRGMSSDDWTSFVKRHQPKDEKASHTDFYNRLIAETAVEPPISMEQIKTLRTKLGPVAITRLIVKAREACTVTGVDVPKLPVSSRNLAGGRSED